MCNCNEHNNQPHDCPSYNRSTTAPNNEARLSEFTDRMKQFSDNVSNSIEVINKISEDGAVKPALFNEELIYVNNETGEMKTGKELNDTKGLEKTIGFDTVKDKPLMELAKSLELNAVNPAAPKLEETTITKVEYDNLKRENNMLRSHIESLRLKIESTEINLDRLSGALIQVQSRLYDTKLNLRK